MFPGALKAALFLVGLVACGFLARRLGADRLLGLHPNVWGAAALVGGGALLSALGVPRQVVAFGAGYVFGFWAGGALAMAAQILGCVADFYWARAVAGDWARRRLTGRMARWDRWVCENPFGATLTLRLLPVGNNLLLNLLAGVSGVRAAPFFAASALGYLPQTVIFLLAGRGVQVQRGVQLWLAAGLFVASAALGAFLLRRERC